MHWHSLCCLTTSVIKSISALCLNAHKIKPTMERAEPSHKTTRTWEPNGKLTRTANSEKEKVLPGKDPSHVPATKPIYAQLDLLLRATIHVFMTGCLLPQKTPETRRNETSSCCCFFFFNKYKMSFQTVHTKGKSTKARGLKWNGMLSLDHW